MTPLIIILITLITSFFLLEPRESKRKRNMQTANSASGKKTTMTAPPINSFFPQQPIFTPDKRYIWDGQRWVRNNGGFSFGLFVGIVLAAGLAALMLYVQF